MKKRNKHVANRQARANVKKRRAKPKLAATSPPKARHDTGRLGLTAPAWPISLSISAAAALGLDPHDPKPENSDG